MAARHVVDPLIDGHELLRNVTIRDGDQHRRPAAREASVIQQAGRRMRGDRCSQLGKAHLGQPLGRHLAVDTLSRARLGLVDVMQQGGDLDQPDLHRNAGRNHHPRRLGGHAGDAT